jgi:hypothetical protein
LIARSILVVATYMLYCVVLYCMISIVVVCHVECGT